MNRYAERTLKHLMEQLGSADQKLIDRQIDELIEKNTQLTGNSEGFLLGGMFFTRLDNVAKLSAKKRPLHSSLYATGHQVLEQCKKLKDDMLRIKQGLSVLLFHCYNAQDVRDALPDLARHLVPGAATLERTRPEAYTLEDKPFSMHSYQHTKELLEDYISTRILV